MSHLTTVMEMAWRAAWQGSLVVVLALGLAALLGRRLSPGWRYGLWLVVLLRWVLPVQIQLPWTMTLDTALSPVLWLPAATTTATHAAMATAPAAMPVASGTTIWSWVHVAMAAWAGGTCVALAILAWSWWRVRRMVASAPADAALDAAVAQAATTAGCSTVPAARWLSNVACPAAFGLVRPVILVPPHLQPSLESQEMAHALVHECLHLRRYDVALAWVALIVRCLHWWNPLVWVAVHRLRSAQELACDASVLASGAHPRSYAGTLLHLAESAASLPHPVLAAGAAGARDDLMERLQMIQHPPQPTWWQRQGGAFALSVLGMVVLVQSPGAMTADEPAIPAASTVATLDATPDIREPWRKVMEERLQARITFDFQETNLAEVAVFLAKVSGCSISVTPQVANTAITLKVQDVALHNVLVWVAKVANAHYELHEGLIVVDAGEVPPVAETRLYTLKPFAVEQRQELLHVMQKVMGWSEEAASLIEDQRYLRIRALPEEQQVAHGILCHIANGQELLPPPDRLNGVVSVDYADAQLTQVVDHLRQVLGLSMIVDPALENQAVTLRAQGVPSRVVLEMLARQVGGTLVEYADACAIMPHQEHPQRMITIRHAAWDSAAAARFAVVMDGAVQAHDVELQRWGSLLIVTADFGHQQQVTRAIAQLSATAP